MQANGETDADTCAFNDLALIKIDPADVGKVNPSVPFWGGPTGLATSTALGDEIVTYGNSSLRGGITQLSPEGGQVPRHHRQRLEPRGLHDHARHPR